MKLFRKVLFWTHLTAGVACGVVILVMSFTGVVLAFKPQIQNWVDRDVRRVPATDAQRLPPSHLLAVVKAARPDANIQSVAFDRDPQVAATVGLGGRDGNVFVNPYTGAILGRPSRVTSEFFQSMTSWHRYMGVSGENRAAGRQATGVSNLAFLLLGLTGLYIWWPKQLTATYLRPILWFKSTSTGKARDFNWHNVIGFWCLLPIVIMTASGAVISYSWASNLVYRLAGSPVPVRGGGPGGPGGPGGSARTVIPASLDLVFARAERQVPTWSQLSMRLPNREGGPVSFTLTDGAQWNAFARSQLTVSSANGEVVQWQPYSEQSRGQKWRGWMRFAHTGELGGFWGQLVAGLGCLGGVFLVYTGIFLAFRRLWHWKIWRRSAPRTSPAEGLVRGGAAALMDES